MSDTPETDAAKFNILHGDDHHGWRWIDAVPAEIARKLERERDEAREQLRVAVGLLSTTPQFQDQHPEEVLKFVEEAAK